MEKFTDGDLKRLKESLEKATTSDMVDVGSKQKWQTLLSRLEASERVCLGVEQFTGPRDLADLILAWRKEKGER